MITTEPEVFRKIEKGMIPPPMAPLPHGPKFLAASIGLKIAIVAVFVLSVFAFLNSGVVYQALKMERKDKAMLEANKIQLQDQIDTLKSDNEKLRSQADRMREQVKTYVDGDTKIKAERDAMAKELSNVKQRIRLLEEENKNLVDQMQSAQVAESQNKNVPSEGQLPDAVNAVAGSPIIAAQVLKATPVVEAPKSSDQKKKVEEAPKAEASKKTEEKAAQKSSATPINSDSAPQVMTVNRKFNFVVINVGLKNDIKMGDRLAVMHNGKNIGAIQVEKLYDRFAAATILQEDKKTQIEKGDQVTKI